MLDRTLLTLGCFNLDALILAPGETCIENLGAQTIAVILVSGTARCNGSPLQRWQHQAVTHNYRLETQEGCVIARMVICGADAVHLGENR